MPKVGDNIVTAFLSEKLSSFIVFREFCNDIVFQSFNEKKCVVNIPRIETIERFNALKQNWVKYQETVLYIKKAKANDAEIAYAVSIADFRNAPLVDEIDVSNFNGKPNSYIQVRAVADFIVKEVTVTIQNSEGKVVENGIAVLREGGIWWRYTTTTSNEPLADGGIITIRMSDILGSLTIPR